MRVADVCAVALLSLVCARAEAVPSCSVEHVTSVAFGSYDSQSASPLDSAGSVTYRCQGMSGSDTVLIEVSTGQATSYSPRQMNSGSNTLSYNLYLDASRATIWGDGSSPTSRYGPVTPPNDTSINVTIYGRIPAGQSPAAGVYSDSLVITLVF